MIRLVFKTVFHKWWSIYKVLIFTKTYEAETQLKQFRDLKGGRDPPEKSCFCLFFVVCQSFYQQNSLSPFFCLPFPPPWLEEVTPLTHICLFADEAGTNICCLHSWEVLFYLLFSRRCENTSIKSSESPTNPHTPVL